MAKKILVVDDERTIVKGIKYSLEQDGMAVDCAYDGEEALELARNGNYDMIMLDVMLPKLDGFQVCQQIREFSNVPIVMLTAKVNDIDKIMGLEYGADDYITKPFNITEVKLRIKAIMRRVPEVKTESVQESRLEESSLKLNNIYRRVTEGDREINLTSREFELLEFLVSNPRKVYSRDELLHTIWGKEYPGDARTVDVHIRRLREKLEKDPGDPRYVRTKWGEGYYFEP